MLSRLRSRKKKGPSRTENPLASDSSQQGSSNKSIVSNASTDAKAISIKALGGINSVGFLANGKYIVSAGHGGKIQRWHVEDGEEVGTLMDVGTEVYNLAVSQDGVWIVCGTYTGQVIVWDATSDEKVTEFEADGYAVNALDISADATKIATGSEDETLNVWSFPAGERILGPLRHDGWVVAVKFSPDVRFIATATWGHKSVRVYDGSGGHLIANFPIPVDLAYNESLAWASDSNRLYALSKDGNINCLSVSVKETLAKWRIHTHQNTRCIAVACNDTVIATSTGSSVSFWDTTTHQEIGNVVHHSHNRHDKHDKHDIWTMAISPSYTIATAGDDNITLHNLRDNLPPSYSDNIEKPDICESVAALHAMDARQEIDITSLEKTVQELRDQLAISNEEKKNLNESLGRKIAHLNESDRELRGALAASQNSVVRLTETIRSLRAIVDLREVNSEPIARKTNELKQTVQQLDSQLAVYQRSLSVYDKKHVCETLYADGHIYDAVQRLFEISDVITEDLKQNEVIIDWLKEFTRRCVSRLQEIADDALHSEKHNEALSAYSTVLSLTPSPPERMFTEWARMALINYSASEALGAANKLKLPMFYVYRAVCDILESNGRITEALECFRKMQNESSEATNTLDEQWQWELDFPRRCIEKLEKGGDAEMDSKNHSAAIESYSNALSLHPININAIVVKCCKARIGLLEDELVTVIQNIEQNLFDYRGFKKKHAILHSLGRYKEAFDAFEMMLSKMDMSLDPQVQHMRHCYLDTTSLIRKVVERRIRDIPRVLIDTTTGRLCDKSMQAAAFRECAAFNKLRSSMITPDRFDRAHIQQEVEKFYAYVMFSHRWQLPEPSFQMLENTPISELPPSPANDKLINFCKLVKSRRFRWAWSDTCCINQSDKGVQQESIVAMFQWYCHAALTIVHLLGVHSKSQKKGSLWKSIWNTRGWTYQEYVASKVIQFYTEDWKPYLDVELFNHKDSPLILSEMEQATKFTTLSLATLQPGLTRVREKLYLASQRETTREEDIAYCLFGIFDVALPVIYGEGTRAVRRLLEYILTQSSDNVTLLSWTHAGQSSSAANSYLPADLSVYDQIEPPHLPQPIETSDMDRMTTTLQSSLADPSPAVQLYERLHVLPPLSIATGQLQLSGFVFSLTSPTAITMERRSDSIVHVYHATTPILGDIYLETRDNLIEMHGLMLIHPWISPLLDRDFAGGAPQFDLAMRALRLVVRLKQPFGALLLASEGRTLYKRVAKDSFIWVQIREKTPLEELMSSIRTVNVQ